MRERCDHLIARDVHGGRELLDPDGIAKALAEQLRDPLRLVARHAFGLKRFVTMHGANLIIGRMRSGWKRADGDREKDPVDVCRLSWRDADANALLVKRAAKDLDFRPRST